MAPDDVVKLALGLLASLAVAGLSGLFLALRAHGKAVRVAARLRQDLADTRAGLARLEAERSGLLAQMHDHAAERGHLHAALDASRDAAHGAETRAARAEAALEAERQAHGEKLRELTDIRSTIARDLRAMTDGAMREHGAVLIHEAAARFEAQSRAGQDGVEGLIRPLKETLAAYATRLSAMEEARKLDEGALGQQVQSLFESNERLRDATATLATALRTAPKTRGRWGEQQLVTVLEMAGMADQIDFYREHSVNTPEGGVRPDVVVRLPGGRRFVVDAKTPMAAYLEAVETTDEAERDRLLTAHARQMRAHARQLGARAYWQALEGTPDFVVMFVPGDNLYAAAMERDPELFDFAHRQQVIIATPTTFLALAKAVAFGWRQERASEEAARVLEEGTALYRRLRRMLEHVAGLSSALDQTVRRHNALIGAIQTRVLPSARRLHDLGVGSGDDALPGLAETDQAVRQISPPSQDGDTDL
ncbi:MAG: DNA recombination protein RmuC [Alphaproteobacteria bacterium]